MAPNNPCFPRALLFDLDGTLADTEHLHFAATNRALAEYGVKIGKSYYAEHMFGGKDEEIVERLLPDRSPRERRRFVTTKERLFRESVTDLQPTSGLMALLDWADAEGVALALVTSAPRENMELLMTRLGLDGRFSEVVLGDELPETKPHPLPYRTALRRLGVAPEDAIGFEDSPPGIRALRGARVVAVGVATTYSEIELRKVGAQHAIPDFRAPELQEILSGGVR